MHYVCTDGKQITNICNYLPSVPTGIKIIEITDEEYYSIKNKSKIFDVTTEKVITTPEIYLKSLNEMAINNAKKKVLAETDWLVLRHMREISLGLSTSLTHDQYIKLETDRQRIASSINT